MRTKTITIYKIDELPTEEAKENARTWWKELEEQDPAYLDEHAAAVDAAIDYARTFDTVDDCIAALIVLNNEGDGCPWTGTGEDCSAIDIILNSQAETIDGLVHDIRNRMNDVWEKDFESRINDTAHIDDNIMANNYEFTEQGYFYKD